jgi:hypothetical protein
MHRRWPSPDSWAFGAALLSCGVPACVQRSDAAQAEAVEEGSDAEAEPAPIEAAEVEPEAEPAAEPEVASSERPPWPLTTLELDLLATLASASTGADTRATIRDRSTGVIATYRPGDAIREGIEVLSIEPGVVELSNAEEVEYLTVSTAHVELDAGDVFYPDLLDDLNLAHDMSDAVQMPEGIEYVVKSPTTAWGTPRTVAMLRDAIREYARSVRGEPKVYVGDLSLRTGGPFPPHLSHHDGRDVDIAYVVHGKSAGDRPRFVPAHAGNLDVERTWALLQAILDSGAVKYVFMDYDVQRLLYDYALEAGDDPGRLAMLFQYPRGRRASHGTFRHWKSHRNHFHVRFAK